MDILGALFKTYSVCIVYWLFSRVQKMLYHNSVAALFRPNMGEECVVNQQHPTMLVKNGMNPRKQFTQLHYLKVHVVVFFCWSGDWFDCCERDFDMQFCMFYFKGLFFAEIFSRASWLWTFWRSAVRLHKTISWLHGYVTGTGFIYNVLKSCFLRLIMFVCFDEK